MVGGTRGGLETQRGSRRRGLTGGVALGQGSKSIRILQIERLRQPAKGLLGRPLAAVFDLAQVGVAEFGAVGQLALRAQATPRLIWPNGRYVLGSISRNIKDLPAYNAQENIARMHSLQSGDWIFINNRNRYDKLGNHSVIFLDWEAFPVAKVAQLPSGPHRPPNVGKYDLADMPLAHVSEPI